MDIYEKEQPKKFPVAMKYAAIAGVFSFGYSIFLMMMEKSQDQFLGMLGMVVTAVAMFMATREYKNDCEGYLPFKEGFKIGALMGVISSFISNLLNYFYVAFIDSSFIEQAVDVTVKEMESNPQITDEQLEQSIKMVEWMMGTPIPFLIAFIFASIMSCLLALGVAGILKQENPEAV
ncbi:DUF4199 domain-containing protein [Flammeovirga pacifica]|uniref:DUF4199 domain-containing protein n=1 Tax=Flammeovirga pacifica TaxID=915059 RepID=A0A1S1Z1P6_FLAPC|nr:DUF4199 domain-containing protein [Flammeovirga pacifica]OHX67103.1 hypothetical protein NH26_12495 [Flammeovirga pacifica]